VARRRLLNRVLRPVTLVVGVVVIVLLYETRMLDSGVTAWQAMLGGAPFQAPAPGVRLPFSATAYCKGTKTASGVAPRTGVAAADPALLPAGSVVNVATGDAKYNGVYTVMDTGPEVQGRELDLYMWSCHEALRFGRKNIQVTVLRLGWDPRASSPRLIDRLFRGREARRAVPAPEPPPPASLPSIGDDMPVLDEPLADEAATQPPASPADAAEPTGLGEAAAAAPPPN
jgi:3D (Asp-Asp-Asp) domain-containing protein